MNAADFLLKQRQNKNLNLTENVKITKIENKKNNKNPNEFDVSNLKNITLDDVIYGNLNKTSKNKNEILHPINPIDGTDTKKRKVNKNNFKLLKEYLKQQAELINDED